MYILYMHKVYIHVGSAAPDRQNWDQLVRYSHIHIGSFGYITLTYGINQISPKYRQKSCYMRLFIITFRAYPRIMVKCKTTNGSEITNFATREQMKRTPKRPNDEKISRRWRQDVKIASFWWQYWKPSCHYKAGNVARFIVDEIKLIEIGHKIREF